MSSEKIDFGLFYFEYIIPFLLLLFAFLFLYFLFDFVRRTFRKSPNGLRRKIVFTTYSYNPNPPGAFFFFTLDLEVFTTYSYNPNPF